jgi:hypothetical protein
MASSHERIKPIDLYGSNLQQWEDGALKSTNIDAPIFHCVVKISYSYFNDTTLYGKKSESKSLVLNLYTSEWVEWIKPVI